jgi:hypothetical protein
VGVGGEGGMLSTWLQLFTYLTYVQIFTEGGQGGR